MDISINPEESAAIVGITELLKKSGMPSKFAIIVAPILGILYLLAKNNLSLQSVVVGIFTGLLAVAGHTTVSQGAKLVGGNQIK